MSAHQLRHALELEVAAARLAGSTFSVRDILFDLSQNPEGARLVRIHLRPGSKLLVQFDSAHGAPAATARPCGIRRRRWTRGHIDVGVCELSFERIFRWVWAQRIWDAR